MILNHNIIKLLFDKTFTKKDPIQKKCEFCFISPIFVFATKEFTTIHGWKYAANQNNLDYMKWLYYYKIRVEKYMKLSLDLMAFQGNYKAILWFHNNNINCFSKTTMNMASKSGNLKIVKFLHENRKEGCTQNALNLAIKFGNLQVANFLVDNRKEGLDHKGIKYLVKYGNTKLLKKIMNKFNIKKFKREHYIYAANNGNLEMIDILIKNIKNQKTEIIFDIIYYSLVKDHIHILQYMYNKKLIQVNLLYSIILNNASTIQRNSYNLKNFLFKLKNEIDIKNK